MTALVAIPDQRRSKCQRRIDGLQHERQFQGIRERPTQHVAGKPIQHRDQIHPARAQTDVCDIDPPDMIWIGSGHAAQEIRIDLLLSVAFAQVRAGIDRRDAHLVHIAPQRIAGNRTEFRLQQHLYLPRAIKRTIRIDGINAMFDCDFACRWRHRSIIVAGAADAQQARLGRDGQLRVISIEKRAALDVAQDGSFFFNQLTWVVRRPISAYSSSSCWAWATSLAARSSRRSKSAGRLFRASSFHSRSRLGWTPCSALIWAGVFSSFSSSSTTWALKVAV